MSEIYRKVTTIKTNEYIVNNNVISFELQTFLCNNGGCTNCYFNGKNFSVETGCTLARFDSDETCDLNGTITVTKLYRFYTNKYNLDKRRNEND